MGVAQHVHPGARLQCCCHQLCCWSRPGILGLSVPGRAEAHKQRGASAQGLQTVNRELEALAGKSGQRVGFWDCGAPFFAGPEALNASLLLDALHPSPEGDF